MSLTIIQQLTLCKAGPHGIISQLLCDVCNLLAIGLECTGALGASMRGAMIAYMPNGGVYAPPAGATVAPAAVGSAVSGTAANGIIHNAKVIVAVQ